MAELSAGEARLRARSRRWWRILLAVSAAGAVPGFILGYVMNDEMFDPSATWPAWIAILLAGSFLVAVSVGTWLLCRQVDEHQRQRHGKAAVLAVSVVIVLYPVWWMLWMGGLVAEPSHWVIFLTLYLVYALGVAYYRLTS